MVQQLSLDCLLDLITEVLLLINSPAFQEKVSLKDGISVEDVVANNDGTIGSKYSVRHVRFAMEHFGLFKNNLFSLSVPRVRLCIALQVLHAKPDGYKLGEYVELLKSQLEIAGLSEGVDGQEPT